MLWPRWNFTTIKMMMFFLFFCFYSNSLFLWLKLLWVVTEVVASTELIIFGRKVLEIVLIFTFQLHITYSSKNWNLSLKIFHYREFLTYHLNFLLFFYNFILFLTCAIQFMLTVHYVQLNRSHSSSNMVSWGNWINWFKTYFAYVNNELFTCSWHVGSRRAVSDVNG